MNTVISAMIISLQISQWSFLYFYKLDECTVPSTIWTRCDYGLLE